MRVTKKLYAIINWFFNKPKLICCIVFTTLSFLFIYIAFQNYKINKENNRVEMSNTLNVITNNIEQLLKNCYTTTLSLALTIDNEGNPQDFNAVGKRLLESNNSIDAVQLVPDGVIQYVYPLEGNEKVLGLDILNSDFLKEEALKSIKTQKMYFAGPFELTQGGKGIVGRLPVYLKNEFWGYSAVIIKLDKLLKNSGINSFNTKHFYFQLSKINPNTKKEEFFLEGNTKLTEENHVSSYISDGDWKISLVNRDSSSLKNEFILKIFIALLVAYTLAYFIFLLFKKPQELELLVKEQANELIRSELKFKTIFDQASLGIANVDIVTGKFIEVNEKFCSILGYTQDEIKNMDFQSITHPDDLKEDIINIEKIKRGIIDQYTIEKRYFKKNEQLVWVSLNVTLLKYTNFSSSNESAISIVEDITERKNAEKIILENQLRTQTLIDTIDGIVWECDANTFEFSFISKKVKNILGYTAEEWLSSKTFWEDHIYHKDKENVINFCIGRTNENKNHDFEYRMVAKDGSIVWLRDIVNVISEDGIPVSLRGIMIDITMTKEIQKNLNNSFELVSKQNDRLLNFSYIVSHNLRSHTSNISSLIELIETADSEKEKLEMLNLLKSVSNSLNDTMINLNEVVNIQTNTSLNTQKINLNTYVEATLKVLKSQIDLHEIEVNNLVADHEEIIYNPAYIESILFNIISNAIKFSHKERKAIITIKCYPEKRAKIIEISDNGIGIDLNKNNNKIFGLYKTFSNLNDSKGIGLYITKNQINAMGGNIKVESEPNVGTTFKILVL